MHDEQLGNDSIINPAISVIIPLYNAEKYIGECIDSILAQTFKDFELIIVDDCSTDSSCEIVESYMPKFNGRLKLYHTEKNTGSGVIARNIGLTKASGEYVYNMDNDDALIETALEEMYNLAKEYDADVVYCERYYMSESEGEEFIRDKYIAPRKVQKPPYVNAPTLMSEDLSERVQQILDVKIWVAPWLKLVRRDVLERHKIIFPVLRIGDDDIWTYALIFFAKTWLRVPNMIYIRRMRDDSISESQRPPQDKIRFWLNPILLGLKELDNFINQIDFFKENPKLHYAVLEKFFYGKLHGAFENANYLTKADVYEAIRNEFGKNLGEYDVLISALCTTIFRQQQNFFTDSLRLEQIEENQKLLAEKDAEINRLKAALAFQTSLLPQANYAISVIIPLYNAAEFVGQCLESLLIQSFQDFEVIVVDDCSTDNSVDVVESYRPKFNGRLRLTKTETNSGGGGYVPRNIGFKLARGSYVYFMDADDFILGTALETLYTTATNNEVDVIYTAAAYDLKTPNDSVLWRDSKKKGRTSAVLEGEERDNLIHGLAFEDNFTQPWVYFVRREFLLQNNIAFPEIMKAGDYLWAISICCQAKKIYRLMKPLYFYNHYNTKSVSRRGSANISHSTWTLAFVDFVKTLNELAGKIKFLSNNPDYVYGITERYFKITSKNLVETNKSLSNQEIYTKLFYEFINNPSELVIPFFFRVINDKQKELADNQAVFRRFRRHIFARIDIKLFTKTGDLQILSLSDDKAELIKPLFFQKNGVGYVIQSCVGALTFIAKSSVDGKISLSLKGLDVRDPDDKSKRIPYWIDYTKLAMNEQTIFDTITPAWHDKPYAYTVDAKADEEIKIRVEWLPHRSDTIEPPVPKAAVPAPKTRIAFARIDVKFLSAEGDFQILSLSDSKAKFIQPPFLQKNGIGYLIQSSVGTLNFIAKATVAGKIQFNFMGIDVRDPDDKSKRIPHWIDYTKLTVRDQTIFDTITPAWHDEPYVYTVDAKADEEIKIRVEWLPHRSDTIEPPVPKAAVPAPKTRIAFARIDVKFLSAEGDFQILSLSDSKAKFIQPPFLQKNGIGYLIQSSVGTLNFIAKATVAGKIQFNFMGIDVRDPDDKSKRIPHWIDYTKLTVRDQTIFDTITPAWHDEPYVYTVDAKADEEIKIQVDWQPHRSDIIETSPKVPALESKVATPSKPETVKPKVETSKVTAPLIKHETAKIDVKLQSADGDLEILSLSDKNADVSKPAWLQKKGVGYSIQSEAGKLEFIAKATANGRLNCNLKGLSVVDPNFPTKRIPYWVNYTKFIVNDKMIFNTRTPAWNDKPFRHSMDIKAGDEIKIQVEW